MRMGELIANSYVYFRPYNPFTAVALSLLGQAYKVVSTMSGKQLILIG